MHHDHHPISIGFPLQLPNTIFILWFSLYRNKQIFITFLPPPLPSHVYWSVNTKQKRKPFYSEFFQKLKKRNLEPILSVLNILLQNSNANEIPQSLGFLGLIRLWLCGLHVFVFVFYFFTPSYNTLVVQ